MKKICFVLLFLVLGVAACGGPASQIPTPTPSPDEWLDRAAQAISGINSAQFVLLREGQPAVLDPSTNTTFTEATGKYQAPDRVSATLKINLLGNVVSVQTLWLPEGNFISNPLTGRFEQPPAGATFNGAAMFAENGLPGMLGDGIQNATFIGTETVEGVETYHLQGEADGAQLASLTAGVLTAGTSYPVDVWMDTNDWYVVRLHITEPDGNGWLIDLFAINEPVEINAP